MRTLLEILGLEYQSIALETYRPGDGEVPREPLTVAVRDSPAGEPGPVVHGTEACLFYLCRRYDSDSRLTGGTDAHRSARIFDWVFFAHRLADSLAAARRYEAFGDPILFNGQGQDVEAARAQGHRLLELLDRHLWFAEEGGHDFIVGNLSLADIACFGDVALAEEGGVDRQDYPAIRRWCDRVKRVPHYPLMPGIYPTGAPALS
ncbi:glutathione binding-like protein [Ruania zhangjianzhongii]|uniref:glutathione binding-like protein n=1 Tax=Ruania zhangjianzhongii TaxID=2603206 RepID=UPI00143CD375|nr:glutathione binding-like protein [Ruania zhangjianzhongii]